jgi:hypothetical protein
MVTLDKKDGFAASGEISFKEAAMTFFSPRRQSQSQEQAEQEKRPSDELFHNIRG